MRTAERLFRFLSSDPDYEPFGMRWLRGLTPARVGLLLAICLLFAAQAGANALLEEHEPILVWIEIVVEDTGEIFVFLLPTLFLVTVADNLSATSRTAVRVGSLALAVILGAAIYAGVLLVGCDAECVAGRPLIFRNTLGRFAQVVSWGGLLTGTLFFLGRERRMGAATHQAGLDRISLDGQMAEARLQMLQAQIEPHFLFNSLATVQSLYRQDPQKGRLMIGDLSEYLRGALPHMREAASTLRKEFALCEAYLRVLQVRMGKRLRVEIDLPRELEDQGVPPMMLPTLIENAVKHGISPLPQGGTVRIQARQEGGKLEVSVVDDGAGFRRASGAGIGLANTRARLASLFGTDASLTVASNATAGVTATLRLPVAMPADARPSA